MKELLTIDGVNANLILSIMECVGEKNQRPILQSVNFKKLNEDNIQIIATDGAIANRLNTFAKMYVEELSISASELGFLKQYKKYGIKFSIIETDENDYVVIINDKEKYFIKTLSFDPYPNIDFNSYKTSDYEITFTTKNLEKLLKSLKASQSEAITLSFNNENNIKPAKAKIKIFKDYLDMLVCPCQKD